MSTFTQNTEIIETPVLVVQGAVTLRNLTNDCPHTTKRRYAPPRLRSLHVQYFAKLITRRSIAWAAPLLGCSVLVVLALFAVFCRVLPGNGEGLESEF